MRYDPYSVHNNIKYVVKLQKANYILFHLKCIFINVQLIC